MQHIALPTRYSDREECIQGLWVFRSERIIFVMCTHGTCVRSVPSCDAGAENMMQSSGRRTKGTRGKKGQM